MNAQRFATHGLVRLALSLMIALPFAAAAQVPVDDNDKVIGAYDPVLDAANENLETGTDIPLMSDVDLEELVGPVALYPDDLLAIILPAAAYPLQIVAAARFLEELETDPSLEPDPDWDDSIVALLNYPEVVRLMSDDIDWTWRLGEAVIAQQGDVVLAIESFRDLAYNAGNLKSDEYQHVSRDEGYIEITPVQDDVIYVPYYEPERVVVYQPRPVYYYYPRSYPIYYYPYSSAYRFDSGFFWGVTTAFSIGWFTDSLHVHHHSYHGHPYFGHHYRDHYWYRRPTMHSYRVNYARYSPTTVNRYRHGDNWHPRHDRNNYVRRDVRATNNRYIEQRAERRETERRRTPGQTTVRTTNVRSQEPITFRERNSSSRVRQNSDYVAQQRETRRDTSRQTTARQTTARQTTDRATTARSTSTRQTAQRREQPAAQQQQRQQPVAQRQERRQEPVERSRDTQRQTARQPREQVRRESPQQTRQQRSSPPPQQRQQRSQPQQREQRAAPAPKQRSEPQRHARNESQSSNERSSSSERSGNRSRRR